MKEATKRDAAKHFGVSLPALDAWIDRGAPVLKRHASGRIAALDLDALEDWIADRDAEASVRERRSPELDHNLARHLAARADKAEHQVETLRRETVRTELVRAHWGALSQHIAGKLHAARERMVKSLVANGCEPDTVRRVLRRAVDEAIAELTHDGMPRRDEA